MKKSLYQSILAMLLSIVTLTPVANPVAMAAQIDHEPDSFVEELEEPDESDDAGQGKDIPDLEDVISNEDEENENSSEDQIESADVDENEVIMLQLRVKAMNKDKKLAQVFDPQVYYCKAKRKVLDWKERCK